MTPEVASRQSPVETHLKLFLVTGDFFSTI